MLSCLFYAVPLNAYHIRQYDKSNGLSSDHIKGMVFDRYGYLWIGTENGFDRFDGSSFNHYDLFDINTNFSAENRVEMMYPLEDGSVLGIAIDGTIFRAVGDTLSTFDIPEDFFGPSSNCTVSDNAEILYSLSLTRRNYKDQFVCINKSGILEFSDKTCKIIYTCNLPEKNAANPMYRMFNYNEQLFYLDQMTNLWLFKNGNWHLKQSTLINISDTVKLHNSKVLTYPYIKHIGIKIGAKLYLLKENKQTGKFDPTSIEFPEREGNINYFCYSEKLNTLCIGTVFDGLYIITDLNQANDKLYKTGAETGLISIDSSIVLSSNLQVIHTKNGSISKLKGINFNQKSDAFINDRYGRLIFFSNGEKPLIYRSKIKKTFELEAIDANSISDPKCIFEDPSGFIWIFHLQDGAFVYSNPKNEKMRLVRKFDNLLMVKKAICQGENLIAFNSKQFIFKVDLRTFEIKSIKMPKYTMSLRDAIAIGIDSFLCVTYGSGPFLYLKGRVRKLPIDQSEALKFTHCINKFKGHYILSTNSGLIEFTAKNLMEHIKFNEDIRYRHLKQFSTFKDEFNGNCSPCSQMKDGHILYPHIEGIVDIDISAYLLKPSVSYGFFLDSFSLGLNTYQPTYHSMIHFELPSNQPIIRFKTSTIHWSDKNSLAIRAVVINNDFKFDSTYQNNSVIFQNLPSGLNFVRFELYNSDSLERIIKFTILVKKKLYEKWSFWLLILIGLTSITIITLYLYGYILKARNRILRRKIKAATEELQKSLNKIKEDKENLEQAYIFKSRIISVITHDVLGPLSFTNIILEQLCNKAGEGSIKKMLEDIRLSNEIITRQAFEILTWSKARKNGFKPTYVKSNLGNLINGLLGKFAPLINLKKFTTDIDIPASCRQYTDTSIISIILSNLLENAIKYGDTYLCIRYSESNTSFKLIICNDGKGFDKRFVSLFNKNKIEDAIEFVNNPGKGGYGLRICKELAASIGGTIFINQTEAGEQVVELILPIVR